MGRRKKRNSNIRASDSAKTTRATILLSDASAYDAFCLNEGYTRLSKNPEVVTAVRRISDLISSMTIHLMANTANGDTRIINELSRKLDINPNRYMTRKTYMSAIVQNMYLTGDGNSVVRVHTKGGLLGDLEPIQPERVSFVPEGYGYYLLIDGRRYDPDDVLHFVLHPNSNFPWMGEGIRIPLKAVTTEHNLRWTAETLRRELLAEHAAMAKGAGESVHAGSREKKEAGGSDG